MRVEGIHVFAGPNGVGKSTLGDKFSSIHGIRFINPDAIKAEQERRSNSPITASQLQYILDIYIENTLKEENVLVLENNLHNEQSVRFIRSYANKFNASCFCYFHYLDDVNELIRRVANRERHLGHSVPEPTIRERYAGSIATIENFYNYFDEVHFYDTSTLPQSRMFSIVNESLSDFNEEVDFDWSNILFDKFLELDL